MPGVPIDTYHFTDNETVAAAFFSKEPKYSSPWYCFVVVGDFGAGNLRVVCYEEQESGYQRARMTDGTQYIYTEDKAQYMRLLSARIAISLTGATNPDLYASLFHSSEL
jgi:hypothetical protein